MKISTTIFAISSLIVLCVAQGTYYSSDVAVTVNVPSHMRRGARAQGHEIVELVLGMPLENKAALKNKFWSVSTPGNPDYGNHLNNWELKNLLQVDEKHVQSVKDWCAKHGIVEFKIGQHNDNVLVHAPVNVIEQEFQTTMHHYTDTDSGKDIIRTHKFTVPKVFEKMHFVGGLAEFHKMNGQAMSKPTVVVHSQGTQIPISTNALHKGSEPEIVKRGIEAMRRANAGKLQAGQACVPNSIISISSRSALNPFAIVIPCCANGQIAKFDSQFRACFNSTTNDYLSTMDVTTSYLHEFNTFAVTSATTHVNLLNPLITKITLPNDPISLYVLKIPSLESYRNNLVLLQIKTKNGVEFQQQQLTIRPEQYTTLDNLHEIYDIPLAAHAKNSSSIQAFASFTLNQGIDPEDIQKFEKRFDVDVETLAHIDGTNAFNASLPNSVDLEASLDSQTMLAVGRKVKTWYVLNNQYMASYLTQILNYQAPFPLVHSISYGAMEDYVSANPGMKDFLDTRFQMTGTLGISMFASSGDNGVGGNNNSCGAFQPSVPASSPYVTAVGATMRSKNTRHFCSTENGVLEMVQCNVVGESACTTAEGALITTGGGFSYVWDRKNEAPYQEKVVEEYLQRYSTSLPFGHFKKAGRAFPDVSMLGHNFVIVAQGWATLVDGTSASSPAFAAMISLINDKRMMKGMKPMGFLNPWLYQVYDKHPEAFNDITTGSNNCTRSGAPCCNTGFVAGTGYDPVTGLGTPDFPSLLTLALAEAGPDAYPFSYLSMPGMGGPRGIQGIPGTQGPMGPTGAAGKDGKDGKQGAEGKSNSQEVLVYVLLGFVAFLTLAVVVMAIKIRAMSKNNPLIPLNNSGSANYDRLMNDN